MKRSKKASAIALVPMLFLAGMLSIPFLSGAGGDMSPLCTSTEPPAVADDETPTILGPSTLTVTDLRTWWTEGGRTQPAGLGIPIDELIAIYLSESDAEGVRGDLAFAQAVAETGYFTNSDTAINNFAGIAHYDDATSGSAFADPIIGVRGHIQLLKKYAAGNNTPHANPDVSPNAGATAATWGGLTGTWASSPTYWELLDDVYASMLRSAGITEPDPAGAPSLAGCPAGDSTAVVGDYALPVDRHWYDEHPEWFTKPHHDYPAADIPVPTGTPLYAVTNGVIVSTPTSGRCGIGIVLNGNDGAQYTYCHGQPGSHTITTGDSVTAGQHIMNSASTGNSTGPHLHFAIQVDGLARCPQRFLTSLATPARRDLPSSATEDCVL